MVTKVADKLRSGKAASSDNIYNDLLKNLPTETLEILTDIFNKIISSGKMPNTWKESVTFLLYKGKGNKTSPANFRPIALISCAYKIYSHIQNDRLTQWNNSE
jgi:hypothetical protein